jgi:hypothetical protein
VPNKIFQDLEIQNFGYRKSKKSLVLKILKIQYVLEITKKDKFWGQRNLACSEKNTLGSGNSLNLV